MNIVSDALVFATNQHKDMVRKGTRIPYMAHLLNVCKILAEKGQSDEVLAAALLHDIVEDTPIEIEEIKQRFGPKVYRLVRAATEPLKLQKYESEEYNERFTWPLRKMHTIEFVSKEATEEELYIILADKLDNIRSIEFDLTKLGEEVWNRFNANYENKKWYYQSVNEAFQARSTSLSPAFRELSNEFSTIVQQVFS